MLNKPKTFSDRSLEKLDDLILDYAIKNDLNPIQISLSENEECYSAMVLFESVGLDT